MSHTIAKSIVIHQHDVTLTVSDFPRFYVTYGEEVREFECEGKAWSAYESAVCHQWQCAGHLDDAENEWDAD